MAKLEGIIKLQGTLDGMNFYSYNGKTVVRKAGGGFNGNAIKTSPNMQRVRENGSEFGHSSRVNRVFRNAILSLTFGTPFPNFHRYLMPLFTNLQKLDTTSVRGARKVSQGFATAEGKKMFCQFGYTPDCTFTKMLPFDATIEAETYRLELQFLPFHSMKAPKGATHISLQYGVLAIDFDRFETQLYQATPLVLPLTTDETHFDLVPEILPSVLPHHICILGVRYYQQQEDTLYLLNARESIGLRILGVV
ncbi:hypothetical protein IU405_05025 [Polaribacter sp. BAL334]|uniref:hypothetical protein n=1 Tax=Polaribacter sp. BAL334 TaxID=1708178 RepID=UPI0018D1F7A9|nr:hypothetical protein [Polaribacter sp. BAL334]MBG7611608.1 hypothetical protein [Polaribacter sp. BAL334]